MKKSFTELVYKLAKLKEFSIQDAESFLLVQIENYINKQSKVSNEDLLRELNRNIEILDKKNKEKESFENEIENKKNEIIQSKNEIEKLQIENNNLLEKYKSIKTTREELSKANNNLNLKIKSENYKINSNVKFGTFHFILIILFILTLIVAIIYNKLKH